jgi:DNA-binding phage protein
MPKEIDLLADLRKDLDRRRGMLPAIAQAAGVSYSSLVRIMRGDEPNPRYATIMALREALETVRAH